MARLVSERDAALSLGAAFGVVLALWSANKGMSGVVQALNVAYDEEERRGFVKLTALTLLLTLGAVMLVLFAVAIIVALPPLLEGIGLSAIAQVTLTLLRWPLLAGLLMIALAVLYRYGPSRNPPPWRWASWGSAIATGLWIVASIGFSAYASRFGSFEKTYGTMAAVIVLLTWLNLSAYVVLLGAEINAEIEHRTARDESGDHGLAATDTGRGRRSIVPSPI